MEKNEKIVFETEEGDVDFYVLEQTRISGKDYLLVGDENDKNGEFTQVFLTNEEKVALQTIELGKTQLSYIVRYDSANGGVTYELAKDKQNKMHDDASYTLCMLGYSLSMMRRGQIVNKKREDESHKNFLFSKRPKLK